MSERCSECGWSFYEDVKLLMEGKLRREAAGRAEDPPGCKEELLHLLSQEGPGLGYFLVPFGQLIRGQEGLDALAKGAASFPDLGDNF